MHSQFPRFPTGQVPVLVLVTQSLKSP